MASAGAIVLKSQPWSFSAKSPWPRRVAEQVWEAMERQRIEDGIALRNEASAARARFNTPWSLGERITQHRGGAADRKSVV